MIKRLVWFVSGLATGAGAVVVLGKRIRRRVAALTPVRLAEQGVERVRDLTSTLRDAVRDGVDAMRDRERELKDRFGTESGSDRRTDGGDSSKVIVLHDETRRSSSTRRR